jgi:hypothetical protein
MMEAGMGEEYDPEEYTEDEYEEGFDPYDSQQQRVGSKALSPEQEEAILRDLSISA